MGDRYYEQAVQFAMRQFVEKLLDKYVEYLDEVDPDKAKHVQGLFLEFKGWLYQTTASYANKNR
jgi:hypothetical protein